MPTQKESTEETEGIKPLSCVQICMHVLQVIQQPYFFSKLLSCTSGIKASFNAVVSLCLQVLQVVGYDLAAQPPYWLAKNSWSTAFAAGAHLTQVLIQRLATLLVRDLSAVVHLQNLVQR
jgi:hypothetical protein